MIDRCAHEEYSVRACVRACMQNIHTSKTVLLERMIMAKRRNRQPKIHSFDTDRLVSFNVESGSEGGFMEKLMAMAPPKHRIVPNTFALLYLECTENFSNLYISWCHK